MPKPPPPPLILPTVPSGGGYTPIPYGGDNGSINFPSNGGTGGSAGGGGGGGGAGGGSVKQGGSGSSNPTHQGGSQQPSLLTFVGLNHGIPEFESSLLEGRGAMTPGPFIIYPPGGSKDPFYNTHEPGHVIQFLLLGPIPYYLGVVGPSLITAGSPNAMQLPWEKSASTLNYWFFGTSDPSNPIYK